MPEASYGVMVSFCAPAIHGASASALPTAPRAARDDHVDVMAPRSPPAACHARRRSPRCADRCAELLEPCRVRDEQPLRKATLLRDLLVDHRFGVLVQPLAREVLETEI